MTITIILYGEFVRCETQVAVFIFKSQFFQRVSELILQTLLGGVHDAAQADGSQEESQLQRWALLEMIFSVIVVSYLISNQFLIRK